jgi:lipooligosaccharide transport system ATP-binding protein
MRVREVVLAKGLCKSYGSQRVVNGVDLSVQPGECFGLLGPNGAGKSTTLRMLLGTTFPDAGDLFVLGYPVPAQARLMRQRIGVVPQQNNLDPDFTVVENLYTYASYFGLKRQWVDARLDELLQFAALDQKPNARISELSGGMQRRLTLARALINEPDLIILDEPTTGLDPQARHLIWQRLRALKAKGKTIILTTHYMEEAQRLCDRLAIIDHGKVLVGGTPADLVKQNIEPHVLEFYGAELDEWQRELEKKQVSRLERVGETLFCYCQDEIPILADLQARKELQYLHRPANLEDVFLMLTGRDLRE